MTLILKAALIGKRVTVIEARNPSLLGMHGIIIDETKHTLLLKTKQGVKRIGKNRITLELPDDHVRIQGRLLIGRPEERVKRK